MTTEETTETAESGGFWEKFKNGLSYVWGGVKCVAGLCGRKELFAYMQQHHISTDGIVERPMLAAAGGRNVGRS